MCMLQVPFEVPDEAERYRMLTYYMSKYMHGEKGGNAREIEVKGIEEKHIREAAAITKGFSGGLAHLAVTSKYHAS